MPRMTVIADVHPYEMIPLNVAGYILGALLLLVHLVALIRREPVIEFLQRSSRNVFLGQITLGLAFVWFFLLVAPNNMGMVSSLSVELAEFERAKFILQLLCPVFLILLAAYAKELLFPRALGFLCLLIVAPFMTAAFLKEPTSRILIPIWGYALIIMGLIWVAKPYVYRDMIERITAKSILWNAACIAGLLYGAAILTCAILWW